MPRSIVAGNWKMNTTLESAAELAAGVAAEAGSVGGVELIVCPPFVSLAAVRGCGGRFRRWRRGAEYAPRGVQGAFTGEVSAEMLVGLCQYVILGHSERRQLFGETDDTVNLKVRAALLAGLRPIVCVGETLEQREAGDAADVVEGQVLAGLADVADITDVVVAYEPVWAIGTGTGRHTGNRPGDNGRRHPGRPARSVRGRRRQRSAALRRQRQPRQRRRLRRPAQHPRRAGGRR